MLAITKGVKINIFGLDLFGENKTGN